MLRALLLERLERSDRVALLDVHDLDVAVLSERGGEPLDGRLGGARLAAKDGQHADRLARTATTHVVVMRSARKDQALMCITQGANTGRLSRKQNKNTHGSRGPRLGCSTLL